MKKQTFIFLVCLLFPIISFCQVNEFPVETIFNRVYDDETGGLSVDVQDQTTPPIEFFFTQALGSPTTLSVATAINDTTITVASTTNFVDGVYIGVFAGVSGENRYFFATQVGAPSGNIITVDTPLDFAFDSGDPVLPMTRELDVNGSITAQVFQIQGPPQGGVDITRIMIKMLTSSPVSLDTFGDLTSLTNGLVLRKSNGAETRNIWNIKNNSDLALITFDYLPLEALNPVQGQDGALFRNTFAGRDKHGVAIRLQQGETLQLLIQDDLTGLVEFHALVEGHITRP